MVSEAMKRTVLTDSVVEEPAHELCSVIELQPGQLRSGQKPSIDRLPLLSAAGGEPQSIPIEAEIPGQRETA